MGSRDLRGDGNLGPCLLLDLLQVAALLSDQPAYVVVASDDLQRDVFHPTQDTQRYEDDVLTGRRAHASNARHFQNHNTFICPHEDMLACFLNAKLPSRVSLCARCTVASGEWSHRTPR